MNKTQLLQNLQNDIYCRIKASPIQGVGVFAIRDIKKGTEIFKGSLQYEEIEFTESELVGLPQATKDLIHDFFPKTGPKYFIPEFGLNSLNVSFFLNHSDDANIMNYEDGRMVALKDIKNGEELTSNYSVFSDLVDHRMNVSE